VKKQKKNEKVFIFKHLPKTVVGYRICYAGEGGESYEGVITKDTKHSLSVFSNLQMYLLHCIKHGHLPFVQKCGWCK